MNPHSYLHAATTNAISSPEKGRNERTLAGECRKRKELEAQLEEVNSEHKIAADKNSRMKEAMKVAEMKVAQIQAQVKMYEEQFSMHNFCCDSVDEHVKR